MSNATHIREELKSSCTGLIPDVHPEADSLQKGESVGNILSETKEISEAEKRFPKDDNKQWYLFRATHNRAEQAYKLMVKENIVAYIPMRHVCRLVRKRRVFFSRPFFANLLFVYCSKDEAEKYVNDYPQIPYLSYYYNHFKSVGGKNPPLTIVYSEMINFINATLVRNEHTMMVKPEQVHYKEGDMVKVIAGDFKNVVGRVARIAGQTRVVLRVEGLGLIATAYIPSAFLEYVKDDNIKC